MSSAVFPTLRGLAWDVRRSPMWSTTIQEASSGKETRMGKWSYPRYEWELSYNFLRQDPTQGFTEFSQLMGLFNARQGSFDSFLYTDTEDNTVVAQVIGTGDGTTKSFQLVRAFGGFVEPVLAPNVVANVKLNATGTTAYTVAAWGTTTPGVITFTSAPASGAVITGDITYYWPCRFVDDTLDFSKFLATMFSNDGVKFKSIK